MSNLQDLPWFFLYLVFPYLSSLKMHSRQKAHLATLMTSPYSMNSPSAQFVHSRRIGVYDPIHQISMWGENFKSSSNLNTSAPLIVEDMKFDNQSEDASQGTVGPSDQYDQEATKPVDKVQRRLAQNREAARKSRLRKKAYVQQLETSRLKLIQMEQELERARQQGLYVAGGFDNHLGFSSTTNPGVTTFEMEYGHWVEEQNRHVRDLRDALDAHKRDTELQMLVDEALKHYFQLFRIKAMAAKADVFYVLSGMWKTSTERFFLWIGGSRPSELLTVLVRQIEPMTEQQLSEVGTLQQSCLQAEDALFQGMQKLQYTLAETVATGEQVEGNYLPQMAIAIEKLEALVSFVNEADHIRQETLQQMSRILTTRQAARGLLALGEYFQRLRALSTLWANRPREPA